MNWSNIIKDILDRGFTLQQVASHIGTSRGQVHDILRGRQKSVIWERGDVLLKLRKRALRRKMPKAP